LLYPLELWDQITLKHYNWGWVIRLESILINFEAYHHTPFSF